MVKRQKKPTATLTVSGSSDAATLVLPGLYLGPCSSASSKPFLSSNAIKTVLSVGATPSPKVDGVSYHRLALTDTVSSTSITPVLDAAVDIIDAALNADKGKGKILVHCSAGMSRSPTVVVAYLMRRRQMSLKAALGHVARRRPQIHPNAGFLRQLKEMEVELTGVSTLDVDDLPRREKDRLALFEGEIELAPSTTSAATTSMEPS
jgi:atypical dual specificity phosphatase